MRIRIGDLLVKAGVITELQLKAALAEQHQWGGKLGDILVRMEFLTEEVLVRALSKQTGIARADLSGEGDKSAVATVPADTAEEFGVVPVGLKDQGRTLVVAMSDPLNISATDHLVSLTGGRKIETQLAGASAIRNAISRWYRGEELLGDEQTGGMKIVNNAGNTVVDMPSARKVSSAKIKSTPAATASARQSAVEVLRRVEEPHVLPYELCGSGRSEVVTVAMSHPTDRSAVDQLAFHTGKRIKPMLAGDGEVVAAIQAHYGASDDKKEPTDKVARPASAGPPTVTPGAPAGSVAGFPRRIEPPAGSAAPAGAASARAAPYIPPPIPAAKPPAGQKLEE